MMMKTSKGFTLIEILVALAVFAIMAAISSAALYDVFHTREQLNLQANQLNRLQLAYSLINNDLQLVSARSVRGTGMLLEPAFSADKNEIKLTREGLTNPLALEKRSTLQRVQLICQKGQLIRQTQTMLDSPDNKNVQRKTLISKLKSCHFRVLDNNRQYLDEWTLTSAVHPGQKEHFPVAVELGLDVAEWGKMTLIFILPEALYHEKN